MRSDLLRLVSLGAFVAAACTWAACSDDSDPVDPGTSTGGTAAGGGGSGGAPGGGGSGGSGGVGLPNGESCTAPAECASASCVDGVCCNGVCDRDCEACDVAELEGTCTSYTAGTDPDGLCQGGTCDGVGDCAVGGHLWSAGYGNSADLQRVSQVALDGTGNMVVAGTFEGTINFGGAGDELTSADGEDVFVATLAPDGSHLWSKSFGGAGAQRAQGLDIDVIGNVVLTGSFENAVNFGAGGDELTSAGATDVFVARLDPDGNHLASVSFGDAAEQDAQAMVVTPCGDLVVVGSFSGTVNFGSAGDELDAGGGQELFIARFLPDGGYLWSMAVGDPVGAESFHSVSADIDGNVLLVGQFAGDLDFGGDTLSSQGGTDVFVAKLGPGGAHLWSHGYGDGADQGARGVVIDNQSFILVTGLFDGTINFGAAGDELSSQGGADVFVTKLDSDGTHLWSQRYGDGAEQGGDDMAVAVDWRGSIVIAGGFAGAMDIAGQSLSSAGGQDVYLAKLGSDGTGLWAQSFGDGDEQVGTSLAVGSDRVIVLTGGYAGAVDFGGGALPSQSAPGAFIARFAQ